VLSWQLLLQVSSIHLFIQLQLINHLLDYLGRKWGIIFATLIFTVGIILQTASAAIPLFVVGRVFAGLGVGLVSCLIPMYQSEWSVFFSQF